MLSQEMSQIFSSIKKKLWKTLVRQKWLEGIFFFWQTLIAIRDSNSNWSFRKANKYLIHNYSIWNIISSQMAKLIILKDTFIDDKTVILGFLILANDKLTMARCNLD
jgi:hypothetical protein